MAQSRNKGNNRVIEFNGKSQCLTAWAEEIGLTREALRNRLNNGWSVEDALTIKQRARS